MNNTPNNGGPAFPVRGFDDPQTRGSSAGMTLRDYFAAAALQAFLSNSAIHDSLTLHQGTTAAAYAYADAMLTERNKQP